MSEKKEESTEKYSFDKSFNKNKIKNNKDINIVFGDSKQTRINAPIILLVVGVLGAVAWAVGFGVNNNWGQSPKSDLEKQIPKTSPTPSKPTSTPSKPN